MRAALLATAGAFAVADWIAVARGHKRAEYVAKPAAIIALIGAALALSGDAPNRQAAFTIAALVLSLAGDVFLMLPRDMFVAGLASFLLAHVCYVIAFAPVPPLVAILVAALVLPATAGLFVRIRLGIIERGKRGLVWPVFAYVVAISAMLIAAVSMLGRSDVPGGAAAAAATGGVLFAGSDALIGWRRFIAEQPWMPVTIMVTYHLAQAGFVLALAR